MSISKKFACVLSVFVELFLCVQVVNAGVPVPVRGHYRKNGTYVSPYYRSNPDGNFGNNWSTAGNINPYTGKRGSKRIQHSSSRISSSTRFRSYSSSSSGLNFSTLENKNISNSKFTSNSYVSPDQSKRIKLANELKELGHTVDWRNHSYQSLLSLTIRIHNLNTLKRHGIDSDSESLTHTNISDLANRARKAEGLTSLGVDAQWEKFSFEELSDIEKRLRKGEARELVILDYFDEHRGDLLLTQKK